MKPCNHELDKNLEHCIKCGLEVKKNLVDIPSWVKKRLLSTPTKEEKKCEFCGIKSTFENPIMQGGDVCQNCADKEMKDILEPSTPTTLEGIDKILAEFDEKVNELRNATIIAELQSDETTFGYRVQKGNELFKIVDFGNIKSFIRSHFTALVEEIKNDGYIFSTQDSKPPELGSFILRPKSSILHHINKMKNK